MTETQLKARVRHAIKQQYPRAWIWKISDMFTSGIPDFLVIISGVHIFIEFKVPGNKPTKIQEYTIKMINNAGGNALDCYSVKESMDWISSVLRRKNGR